MDNHGPDMYELGENIRRRRVALRLTQQDLADRVHCSSNHIGKIERAETQPSIDTFYRICLALHCTADQLFSGQLSVDLMSSIDEVKHQFLPLSNEQRAAMVDLIKQLIPFVLDHFS